MIFLSNKDKAFGLFSYFCKKVKNGKEICIATISDHGGEFVNEKLENLCDQNDTSNQFSSPRTP